MATAANIVLKDKTDVNVNYEPTVIKTGEYERYTDFTPTAAALRSQFSIAMRTDKKRKVEITTETLSFPVVVNATTGEIRTAYVKRISEVPVEFDLNARKEVTHRSGSSANTTNVRDIIELGKGSW